MSKNSNSTDANRTTGLILQQDDLKEMLAVVTRAAGNSAQPVHETVRLELDGSRSCLQLSCFNGSFAAVGSVPVRLVEQSHASLHSQTVNAETAKALVSTLTTNEIHLWMTPEGLRIEAGPNKCLLKGTAEDVTHPKIPYVEDPLLLSGKLLKSLAQVAIFASNDPSRPSLTGVLLRSITQPSGPSIEAQAADGIRLGRISKALESAPDEPLSALVPAGFMKVLGDVINDSDSVAIFQQGNIVFFQVKGERRQFTLLSLVLDERFPDTGSITASPASLEAEILLDLRDIALATRQVNIISRDAPTRAVFVKVLDAERVGIASLDGDYGKTRHSILVREASGTGRVWLQAGMLADILNAMRLFAQLRVQIQGSFAPVRIQDENDEFLAVIMPLDIKEDPFSLSMSHSFFAENLVDIASAGEPVAVSL